MTRYRNCYTIKIPCCSIPIQIIHAKNLDCLLNGIDLDPTRICFYKDELVMAESCKNAIESLAFKVNTNNVTKNHLDRVGKYFEKGFDLILPDLDMGKLPTRLLKFNMTEVLDMPYLQIQFDKIEGNKIMGCAAPTMSKLQIELEEGDNELGYAKLPKLQKKDPQFMVGNLIHNNIANLARKEFEKFTFIGEDELFSQAFDKNVTITERMLTNTYATAKEKIWGDDSDDRRYHKHEYNTIHDKLDLSELEFYLPYKPVKDLVQILVNEFIETRAGKQKIFDHEVYGEYVEKKLKVMIADQIKVCKELINGMKGKGSLAIQDIQDKAVKVDNKQFYGKYLKTADM